MTNALLFNFQNDCKRTQCICGKRKAVDETYQWKAMHDWTGFVCNANVITLYILEFTFISYTFKYSCESIWNMKWTLKCLSLLNANSYFWDLCAVCEKEGKYILIILAILLFSKVILCLNINLSFLFIHLVLIHKYSHK